MRRKEKKVGVVFSMKDVFCRKDKRYIKFKGLKKIFYFVRSLWYVPSQNKPKFLKKEEEILKIIKEYSPQIRQQCLDYEKYFFQWENANRRGECGISWYEKKNWRHGIKQIISLKKNTKTQRDKWNDRTFSSHERKIKTRA